MKMKIPLLLIVLAIVMCSLSFAANTPQFVSGAPTEGSTLYKGYGDSLSVIVNSTAPGIKNMTLSIYKDGSLVSSTVNAGGQSTFTVPLVYTKNVYSSYILNLSAFNGTDTWTQSPLTFITIDPSINPYIFTGFSDVGDVIGSFVSNLIVGLLPTIVTLAIVGMIVILLYVVGTYVSGMLKNGFKGKGK